MALFTAVKPMKYAGAPRRGAAVLAIPAALALLLCAASAQAVLYKWVDASGTVVYSDQPPPGGVKSEIVTTPVAPPSNPNAVKEMANRDLEQKKRLAQQAQDEKAAAKARVDENTRRENCQQMRGSLRIYQSGDPIYRLNENGQRVDLDDVAKARERDRLESAIRDQCLS